MDNRADCTATGGEDGVERARRNVREVVPSAFRSLHAEIIRCRLCPRLVAWREEAAGAKPRRFAGEEYWARPLPGFGDPGARVVLVGLAPAAHGGNRTGRMFTGDESGNWLCRGLHRAGFANQPDSLSLKDGLRLTDCYITAAVRCAPPQNKPLPEEFLRCRPYLLGELRLLKRLRVVVGLGKIGFDAALTALRELGVIHYARRPRFGHGVRYELDGLSIIGSYHPSQQNTFTGKLTERMLDEVIAQAKLASGLLRRESG
jgi:uracil-DNA glycosylase family 4